MTSCIQKVPPRCTRTPLFWQAATIAGLEVNGLAQSSTGPIPRQGLRCAKPSGARRERETKSITGIAKWPAVVRPERAAMGMAPASPRWQRKKKSAKVKPRELRRVSHLGAWPRGLGRCWLGIVRLVAVAGIPVEIIGGLHHPHSSQPLIDFASERFTAIPQLVLSLV